ncbi:RHS repeat-associated core domain-containing protein [Pseudomonas sp. LB3P81]
MTLSQPGDPAWQRTVLLATDRSQSIIAETVDGKTNIIGYSAYGDQPAQHEVATGLGFNGQLREMQTSWYLLGNGYRAYNPRLMRFHSLDSWSPFFLGG